MWCKFLYFSIKMYLLPIKQRCEYKVLLDSIHTCWHIPHCIVLQMCGVQRWGSHKEIMLDTIIAHRVSPCNLLCALLSKCLTLNWCRLAITKGLNTWLKTFQLLIFLNSFVKEIDKHNSSLTLWGTVCRPVTNTSQVNNCLIQAITQQHVEKVKGCEYFLKAMYILPLQPY